MSQVRYSIVLEDGTLSGISQHDGNLDAVPLSLTEFVKLVPAINAAALDAVAKVDSTIAAKDAEIAAAELAKAEIAAHLESIKSAESIEAVAEIIAMSETPKKEREKAEITKQIAELQAKLGELEVAKNLG